MKPKKKVPLAKKASNSTLQKRSFSEIDVRKIRFAFWVRDLALTSLSETPVLGVHFVHRA